MVTQHTPHRLNPDGPTRNIPSRALAAVPQAVGFPPPCPELAARIHRAATKAGHARPIVLASAAILLTCETLPLKSAGQRRRALGLALDARLSAPGVARIVALGPHLGADRYLAAALDEEVMQRALKNSDDTGAALPDLIGVPVPTPGDDAWNVWRREGVAYVRQSDHGGFVCRLDALELLWRHLRRPKVFALNGPLPGLADAIDVSADLPPVDPRELALDLRTGRFRATRRAPRRFVRFAAVVAVVAGIGHLGLLTLDGVALQRVADARYADISHALDARAPGLTPDQPLELIARSLAAQSAPERQDRFMSVLAAVSGALAAQRDDIAFRELQFGAREGVLTLLVQGAGLDSLQSVEAALASVGLNVTSGAATTTDGGAEAFMQVAEPG